MPEPIPDGPDPTTPGLDMLRRYVELARARKDLEAMAKRLAYRQSRMEDPLIEWFVSEGLQNMRILGATPHLHRTTWAKLRDPDDRTALADALHAQPEYAHYVKEDFNLNQISALVREYEARDEPIPDWLSEHVEVNPVTTLKIAWS